jgi:hypothetical protein
VSECAQRLNRHGVPLPVPCAELEAYQLRQGWEPVKVEKMHDLADFEDFCKFFAPPSGRGERCVHHEHLEAK